MNGLLQDSARYDERDMVRTPTDGGGGGGGTCFTIATEKTNMNVEHDVEFLVHKDTINLVLGFHPILSRICTIRLRPSPFNITIVRVGPPASDYDDEQVEDVYDLLREAVDQTPPTDVPIVLGD